MKDTEMHGFLLLDKPLGMTSAKAVGVVKQMLREGGFKHLKIGHAGTLDPLASGLLPLAIGEATKVMRFLTDASKEYHFSIGWGEQRSTDDAEGEVIATHPHRPSKDAILAALPAFIGEIQQAPPAFSAIKIDGKRAYALARAGQLPEMVARSVHVHALTLLKTEENQADFRLHCGKGTYVRSLARDLALALGTVGYVSALRRTKVGRFDVGDAFLLEKTGKFMQIAPLSPLPIASVLDDIPAVTVDSEGEKRLRQGQTWSTPTAIVGEALCLSASGAPVGMVTITDGVLKPLRLFNL
jgi:tRNA pseudouridine55 synthase